MKEAQIRGGILLASLILVFLGVGFGFSNWWLAAAAVGVLGWWKP